MDALVKDPSGTAVTLQDDDGSGAFLLCGASCGKSSGTATYDKDITSYHHFTSPENIALPSPLKVISSGFIW